MRLRLLAAFLSCVALAGCTADAAQPTAGATVVPRHTVLWEGVTRGPAACYDPACIAQEAATPDPETLSNVGHDLWINVTWTPVDAARPRLEVVLQPRDGPAHTVAGTSPLVVHVADPPSRFEVTVRGVRENVAPLGLLYDEGPAQEYSASASFLPDRV